MHPVVYSLLPVLLCDKLRLYRAFRVWEIARPWASRVRAASHTKEKKKVTTTRKQINTGFIVAVLSASAVIRDHRNTKWSGGRERERSRWPSARGLSDVAETCDAGVTWRGG